MNPIVKEDIRAVLQEGLPWNRFAGKGVLVAGAAGFIASFMVECLLALNERLTIPVTVYGLARNRDKAEKRFADYLHRRDFKLIFQDVQDPLSIDIAPEFVIHAASNASPKFYAVDPIGTLQTNIVGTANLLQLALKQKPEAFLFVSSAEVYGEVPIEKIPTGEKDYGYLDPMDIRSCYGEGKRAAENLCICWWHQEGVPAKIVRLFHTYGPGVDLTDGRVYSDFVANVLEGKNIEMKSDGRATRSFCYLSDAAAGIFRVLLKGENGQAYNVGNDRTETSIVELANLIASLGGSSRVIRKKREEGDGYLEGSISRTRPLLEKISQLGWQPKIGIREGFERMIRSYSCR